MKQFRSYEEQVALLEARGMHVGDRRVAIEQLRKVNYYRLSGYWYPFRKLDRGSRADQFYAGTTFEGVLKLYTFDGNLRAATLASLAPIELAVRALVGHALGNVDECAHLQPGALNARAQRVEYARWRERYEDQLAASREDFVEHHRDKYGGVLPVWAAVEVLDWGGLTRLYGFSPRGAQDEVADAFGLTAPQLESWMKSLNVVRNVCAHHGRLFNRVFAIAPKLPTIGHYPSLDEAGPFTRTFGQLSLIQHMLEMQGIGRRTVLPTLLRSFPTTGAVPIAHLGAPDDWDMLSLWTS